jgi:hypothetical protein
VGFFSHSFHAEKRNAPSSAPVPIQSLSTPARSGFHNSPSSIEDGFARVYASQAESPVMSADISEDLYHPSSYQPPSLCRRISHSTDLQIAPEETIHLLESMDAECDTEGFVMIEKPDVSQSKAAICNCLFVLCYIVGHTCMLYLLVVLYPLLSSAWHFI